MFLIILAIIVILTVVLYKKKENFDAHSNLDKKYEDIKDNWSKIFPDGNRNSAGPKFLKWILNKKDLTHQDFVDYNKLYCAVSGSLVSPKGGSDFLMMNEVGTNKKICGNYYRCCVPCVCDLMKYAMVKKVNLKFTDGNKDVYLLVIKNPCSKSDFPQEVNKQYFCLGNNLDSNQVHVVDGMLAIGLLHNGRECNQSDIDRINKHEITGQYCSRRNSTPLDQIQSGMGDIFIKLAR